VHEFGGKSILRDVPRPSKSLAKSLSLWRPLAQVKYHTLSDKSWEKQRFVARPLSRSWKGKLQPLLAINESRLFVAAGHTLYSYAFTPSEAEGTTPSISFEASYQLSQQDAPRGDITSLACVPDGGSDRTLFVGFENGELERLRIPPCNPGQVDLPIDGDGPPSSASSRTSFHHHDGELVEVLAVSGDILLSMSTNGKAGLLDLSSPTPSLPHMIDLDTRAWSALLSTSASTPFAAFGTSSDAPLTIHAITPTTISPTPTTTLRASEPQGDPDHERPTAVYGISAAPPASPWGASDQIIVSGWFDGFVRVHDVRASHAPSLTFSDPWSFEPIYAVACGGGGGAYIAAGSARHSVVAFWDVRSATRGWSVHAPGNDRSPVYSIILESSRLFGATESRPFVYDFGPSVKPETYPSLPSTCTRGKDGLSFKKGLDHIGFYVTKYNHPPPTVHAGDH
jgi:WD40 repeat protein